MIYCYPVQGKRKSLDICLAFAEGCGGTVVTDRQIREDGDAFFYGVDNSILHIWKHFVRNHERNYWYCDNSYFDSTRGTHFRVTKNSFQHSGLGQSDGVRFQATGSSIYPWRPQGPGHILVCPQSDLFMSMLAENPRWLDITLQGLKHITDRPVRVRPWDRDKSRASSTLTSDLYGAHAMVVHSSAAAVTALLHGVPVVTMGQCAAEPLSGSIVQVGNLPPPSEDRHNWAGVLADNQWTLEEMKTGMAWRALNERFQQAVVQDR